MTSRRRLERGGSWIDRSKPIVVPVRRRRVRGVRGRHARVGAAGERGGRWLPESDPRPPRGIMTAGPEEPNAFVEVSEPWFDPIVAATMVELVDGLVAEPRAGVGRLPAAVVPTVGGSTDTGTLRRSSSAADPPGVRPRWPRRAAATASSSSTSATWSTTLRPKSRCSLEPPRSGSTTTATSSRSSGRRISNGSGTCAPDRVILATGALERPIAFPGNDRPGRDARVLRGDRPSRPVRRARRRPAVARDDERRGNVGDGTSSRSPAPSSSRRRPRGGEPERCPTS